MLHLALSWLLVFGPSPEPVSASDLGLAETRVLVLEFSDFQCPFCSRVQPTLKTLEERYGSDLELVFMHQPLSFHADARGAALASLAAARQGRFWEMHDALFANQRALKPEDLRRYASGLGLDLEKFDSDLGNPALGQEVDRHQRLAAAVGATGTPTFFINGIKLSGAQPLESFVEVIDVELAAAREAGKRGRAWVASRVRQSNEDLHRYLFEGVEPPDAAELPPKPPPLPDPDLTVYRVPVGPDDPVKGGAQALVTLVEFSDFQCPFCARLQPTLDKVLAQYGGDVRLVFKHNPLPFHKEAGPAARVAICAQRQGKFWALHDQLFANHSALRKDDLERYGSAVRLAPKPLSKCLAEPATGAKLAADMALALEVGARGTPQTYINGRQLRGAQPFEAFQTLIEEELAKARALVAQGTPRDKVYEKVMAGAKVMGTKP